MCEYCFPKPYKISMYHLHKPYKRSVYHLPKPYKTKTVWQSGMYLVLCTTSQTPLPNPTKQACTASHPNPTKQACTTSQTLQNKRVPPPKPYKTSVYHLPNPTKQACTTSQNPLPNPTKQACTTSQNPLPNPTKQACTIPPPKPYKTKTVWQSGMYHVLCTNS